MSGRPWWQGPTPAESAPVDEFAATVRDVAARLLRALAEDVRRLAVWVAPPGDARVEDQQEQP